MHKVLPTLAASAVILGGASAVIAQQGPRAEQDRHGPNTPIQKEANPRTEQNPAADQSGPMRLAAGPNEKPSRGPVEPKKKDVYPTAPKGPADQSAPPPKN